MQLELHRRTLLQRQQQVEQRVGILAAGQADHDPIAFADHVEVGDGPAGIALQALDQLVVRVALFFGSVHGG